MKKLPTVKIYTDGACLWNPGGPGGIGAIVQQNEKTVEISKGYPIAMNEEPQVTNDRMEILACIEPLRTLKEPSEVKLYSDFKLVINCATWKWKRKKNHDLWALFDPLLEKHKVKFEWLKGHASNKWNNRADELAGSNIPTGQHCSGRPQTFFNK